MPHPLEQRIAELQRQARRLLAWYGLGWVVACLLGTILVLGFADYLIRFQDRGIRVMCSLAVLAVAVRSLWQFAYLPLRRRLGFVEIAQRDRAALSAIARAAVQLHRISAPAGGGRDSRLGRPPLGRHSSGRGGSGRNGSRRIVGSPSHAPGSGRRAGSCLPLPG